MEILAPITVLLSLVLIRPMTVVIHEFGHGITALLLKKGPVILYIGSYGDPDKSLVIKVRRLKVFFRYDLVYWSTGVCYSGTSNENFYRNFLVTLMGPIASLMVAAVATYLYFGVDTRGSVHAISLFFMLSCATDFYQNIKPSPDPIKLHDGTLTYNDGASLKRQLKFRKLSAEIRAANELYEQKEYQGAAAAYKRIIEKDSKTEEIYRLGLYCFSQIEDMESMLELYMEYEKAYQADANDYVNIGVALARQERIDEAMQYFQKSLELEPALEWGHSNRGYVYGLYGEFELSLADFEWVLEMAPESSYALSGRGLARIMLGKEELGLADLSEALRINDREGYALKNLGIYHFHQGNFSQSKEHFEKALAMDPLTHGVAQWLEKTTAQLEKPQFFDEV